MDDVNPDEVVEGEIGATDDGEQPEQLDPPREPLAVGTVDQILEAAPRDIRTETIEVPEWNCSVVIKSLTAAEKARIRQVGIQPGNPAVAWGEMEIEQFLAGVAEPKFNRHQVQKLHQTSSIGFGRVIDAHDELAEMSKEELRKAQQDFRDSGESEEA